MGLTDRRLPRCKAVALMKWAVFAYHLRIPGVFVDTLSCIREAPVLCQRKQLSGIAVGIRFSLNGKCLAKILQSQRAP